MRNEGAAARADANDADPVRRGAPPGSLRFYAVLFAPAERRTVLNALYSLEAELRDCASSLSHDIAHTRLQWWRDELQRLASSQGRHPITMALSPLREQPVAPTAQLNELIVGAELDMVRYTYHTWSEVSAYCQRSSGALQSLIASALAAPSSPTERELAFARELGVAVRQVEMLREAHRDGRRGLIYAPLDVLAAHRVTPEAWMGTQGTPERTAVRNEWADRVESMLSSAASMLAGDERARQRHGLVLGGLHRRLLESVRQHAGESELADVKPFARLWTAWRAARTAR